MSADGCPFPNETSFMADEGLKKKKAASSTQETHAPEMKGEYRGKQINHMAALSAILSSG